MRMMMMKVMMIHLNMFTVVLTVIVQICDNYNM